MFKKEDELYFNNPDYDMTLEKYFYLKYYTDCADSYDYYMGGNGTTDSAYPFSNENLNVVFDCFGNLKNKKVLTVGSSGDQALNALFLGAKYVKILDVNLFTQPYVDYKIACMKNLTFKEYFYNCIINNNQFDYSVSKKVFHDINKDSQQFWATLMLEENGNIADRLLFSKDSSINRIKSLFYWNQDYYNYMQNILINGDYTLDIVNAEFAEFPLKADGKYDAIALSNIFKYVGNDSYEKVVNALFDNNLNDKGEIQLHYLYSKPGKTDDLKSFEKMFPGKKIRKLAVDETDTTYYMSKE